MVNVCACVCVHIDLIWCTSLVGKLTDSIIGDPSQIVEALVDELSDIIRFSLLLERENIMYLCFHASIVWKLF